MWTKLTGMYKDNAELVCIVLRQTFTTWSVGLCHFNGIHVVSKLRIKFCICQICNEIMKMNDHKKSQEILQNNYKRTGYDNNYKITLVISWIVHKPTNKPRMDKETGGKEMFELFFVFFPQCILYKCKTNIHCTIPIFMHQMHISTNFKSLQWCSVRKSWKSEVCITMVARDNISDETTVPQDFLSLLRKWFYYFCFKQEWWIYIIILKWRR
jgi:hypothetical protein